MAERHARSPAWRVVAAVLAAILCLGLGVAVLVLSQSSLDVRSSEAAATDAEFEAVRRRFAHAPPYVAVEVRDGRRVPVVRRLVERMDPARIQTVNGIAWSPSSGRRVSASTPYWIFQATRWKAKALVGIVRTFDQQLGLEFELPDLAPLGPGLVLDERDKDGRRIIVWTE